MYGQRKLWEDLPADQAQADLQSRLAETIERQAAMAMDRVARPSALFAPIRWLITIGAVIWFPIAQPILQATLAPNWSGMSREVALLTVELLSAAYLLKSVSFLIIYFIVLWAMLRWDTRRRVNRLLKSWTQPDAEESLSLPAQTMRWLDDLIAPIRRHVETVSELEGRFKKVRAQIESTQTEQARR
jgi:hypothetical protein